MDFLNVALLSGAAALLAPLTIHLFNRQRFQIVDWGAMHLLQAALESNARRPRWESWWLLLIRCFIPMMLAFSMARPVLTHFRQPAARDNQAVLMIIDNSLSMAVTNAQETLLQQAQRELIRIAENSPGTEWSLWSNSAPATDLLPGTTFSLQRLKTALEQTPSPAGSDLSRATLPWGLRQLSNRLQPGRQLILASDFQAEHWRNMSQNELQAISNQLATFSPAMQLFLLPLRTANNPSNLSVELLEAPSQARLNQPLFFVVRISNYGAQEVEHIQTILQVAGRDLSSRTLSIPPGASEQVEFACEFTELGWQPVTIRVEDAGDVHGDDVCYHVVQITSPPQILVIDDTLEQHTGVADFSSGKESQARFAGTSRYLELALAPFAQPQENPWMIQRVPSSAIPELPLSSYVAIVLADVHNDVQNEEQGVFERLSEYVRGGGGLLCFANPLAPSQDVVNQQPVHLSGLLPLAYASAQVSPAEQPAQLNLTNTTFMASDRTRAPLQGLEQFEFSSWRDMIPPTKPVDYRTLLRFQHGPPWLVEADYGRGLVVQCASSCADQGSNLPTRPAYVPLMLSLIERVANHARAATHVWTGESVPLHSTGHSPPAVGLQSSALVQRIPLPKSESSQKLPPIPSFTIQLQSGEGFFTDTRLPGVYSATVDTQIADRHPLQPAMFSVNVPVAESPLTTLSHNELSSLAQQLGATVINSAADYQQAVRIQRDGKELWQWLLWIVVGLLLAEVWIGWRATPPTAHRKS